MATDLRTLGWVGSDVATAQAGAPAGFTVGRVYHVKAAAIDNAAATPTVYALLLDDNLNPRAVQLPLTGSGPFTFQ